MAIATFFSPTVSLHNPVNATNNGPFLRLPASSQPPSLLRPRLSSASLAAHQSGLPLHIAFCSGGDGGHYGGGGGDDGSSSGDGGGGDNAGDNNKKEAVMVLAEAGRGVESLPGDLAAALGAGRIPGSVVTRFFELEKSALFRWLLQFGGFKERLLADDLFLAKVGIECGVGLFTKDLSLCRLPRSINAGERNFSTSWKLFLLMW